MQMCASVQVCECVAQGLGIVAKEIMAGLFLLLARAATGAAAATLRCVAAAVLICVCGFCTSRGSWQEATRDWQLAAGKGQVASVVASAANVAATATAAAVVCWSVSAKNEVDLLLVGPKLG